jgi:hypothetical protein
MPVIDDSGDPMTPLERDATGQKHKMSALVIGVDGAWSTHCSCEWVSGGYLRMDAAIRAHERHAADQPLDAVTATDIGAYEKKLDSIVDTPIIAPGAEQVPPSVVQRVKEQEPTDNGEE